MESPIEELPIRRDLATDLIKHLDRPEITLLIGPRQSGKTTLLKAMKSHLDQLNEKSLFFNLDIERDRAHFTGQEDFVRYLRAQTGREKHYIFIDEIQRLENAGLFLKGLYDRELGHKLIVTGSGSLELKEKIAESLVGRKRSFYLLTVSIKEYAHYKTNYKFEDILSEILATDEYLRAEILQEYLMYGGYPAVLTEQTERERLRTLDEIYSGYIEKDIVGLLNLEKSSSFVSLLRLMANRTGQIINYSDLSSKTSLSQQTVRKYLWYAEKTFVLESLPAYFTNKDKEIVKSPMYYFLDMGLRNLLRGPFRDELDVGFRFENLVFRLLESKYRHTVTTIHYWRSKGGAEVDFVLNLGVDVLPVEVKKSVLKNPKVTRSYRAFLERYKPKEGWIVHSGHYFEKQIGATLVKFKPWYEML
ncbi:MAG: ATP-binding protein [Bacteroidota bacterium]